MVVRAIDARSDLGDDDSSAILRLAVVTDPWRQRRPMVGLCSLVMLVLGVFSACGNGSGASTPTSTTPTTAAPTTTVAPTTVTPTTAPPTTAPPTTAAATTAVANAAELEAAINALYERQVRLYEDPENADVATVCLPEPSACFEMLSVFPQQLVDLGQHTEGVPPNKVESILGVTDLYDVTVVDSNVVGGVEPGIEYLVHFQIEPRPIAGRLVDADGNTITGFGEPAEPDYELSRIVVRWPADKELPWRFAN